MEEESLMRMPFGKYKNCDIAFINSNYLKWLIEQAWFVGRDSKLVVKIEEELKYRDDNDCHFYDDKVQASD